MKKPSVLLAAATIVATLAAAFIWVQLRAARAHGAELSARVTALETAPQPVPPAAAPTVLLQSTELPATKPAIDVRPESARAAAAPAPAAAEPEKPAPLLKAMMEAVQASGAMDQERVRTALSLNYPDLAAELGLSADEANRFLDLLGSQQDDSMEEAMAMMEGGGPPDSPGRETLLRRTEEKQRAREAQQSAMLGAKYTNWQDYQHMVAARNEIKTLGTLLGNGGSPLSDAQAKELLPVIAAEHRRSAQLEREWATSRAASQAPNLMQVATMHMLETQQSVVDVVAKRLTIAQAELYRRKKDQELAMTRAAMGMLGAGGAPSPGMPGGTQP